MKFNRLLINITLLLTISNIFSKRSITKKVKKTQDDDINPDIFLIEKYQSLLGSKDKDGSEEAHEQEYRENEVFKTEEKHYDDDDMDDEVREEEVHEQAENDIETNLLETKSKTKNESNAHARAELKNHTANKLNRIISKNKIMLNEGHLFQKRTNNLLSGIKNNLR